MEKIFDKAREASRGLLSWDSERKNKVLLALAGALRERCDEILSANKEDLDRMDSASPMWDRLRLTEARIEDIAKGLEDVAALPDPVGRTLEERTLPNGIRLRKESVPFGVVGVVYEARPNVTVDVFSLCLKSGNVCLLKGGHDADSSNQKLVSIIKETLRSLGEDEDVVCLLPSDRASTAALLEAVGKVDLVIPRGGKKLITFVRDTSRVPVIETGAGVVNMYFDAAGDIEIGKKCIMNAKTRRVSVCNALDCLIVHSSRLGDLPVLCSSLKDENVELHCDSLSFGALENNYDPALLLRANEEDYGTEFMSYKMAIKTVSSLDEAISHIDRFGSGHSESIITEDQASADKFLRRVDAACLYHNLPTSFTDGAQFGLGAEIGISTQKLGARGPMGLRELNTYKWILSGRGQIRPR